MRFDMEKLASRDRYKLLTGVVVPRPIALVTTIDGAGGVNAAPFSFFNAMGADPALVVLGVGNRLREEPKDTANYIRASGEFIVNVVTHEIAERMNVTACDFPTGVDELAVAGLTGAPSHRVKPPRVAEMQRPTYAGGDRRQRIEDRRGRRRLTFPTKSAYARIGLITCP